MNNMNQNINIAMSHDNFNNFGGVGRNNFQMNNNMNQMNQMCFGLWRKMAKWRNSGEMAKNGENGENGDMAKNFRMKKKGYNKENL